MFNKFKVLYKIKVLLWGLILLFLFSCSIFNTTPDLFNSSSEKNNVIDYLDDETGNGFACSITDNGSEGDLIITEVTTDWIEIYNKKALGTDPVCLSSYKIRSYEKSTSTIITIIRTSLPNYAIEPQSYAIIRFNGVVANSSPDVIIMNGPGLYNSAGRYQGFYEIVYNNTNTVDFIGFCDGSGNSVSPVSGSFSGCVNYSSSSPSFSRSYNLADSDSASDWTPSTVPTFGGANDVSNVTDSDNDGIPDANEQPGTTFAGMPLYDWGARVNQRDIFVHISYMDGWETNKGLAPPESSLEKVKQVFADNGFSIYIDVGNLYSSSTNNANFNLSGKSHEVPYSDYTTLSEQVYPINQNVDESSAIYYKNRYMPINRFGIFHHSLFANIHSSGGSSNTGVKGIAELPGNDFIIYLGGDESYNDDNEIKQVNYTAMVFFHELGHNLGLYHGGNEEVNYKPNYFSSMNYAYAFSGVPRIDDSDPGNFFIRYLREFQGRSIDSIDPTNLPIKYNINTEDFIFNYSYGNMPDIDENNLSEINPLGAGLGNIDWNDNGVIETTNYAFDINPVDEAGTKRVLRDYNEWANLKLPFNYTFSGYNNLSIPGNSLEVASPRFQYLAKEVTASTTCSFGHKH